MADLIRTSYQSLAVIPSTHQFLMHKMYEDNDLDGAQQAERVIDFLAKEASETFVGVLANDSVSPPCVLAGEYDHFSCDFYEPYWYTVLIASSVWEQYKGAVEAADLAWKDAHGCKVKKDAA